MAARGEACLANPRTSLRLDSLGLREARGSRDTHRPTAVLNSVAASTRSRLIQFRGRGQCSFPTGSPAGPRWTLTEFSASPPRFEVLAKANQLCAFAPVFSASPTPVTTRWAASIAHPRTPIPGPPISSSSPGGSRCSACRASAYEDRSSSSRSSCVPKAS